MAFSAATLNSRRTISKTLAAARPAPIGISAPKSAAPALVTKQLSTATQLSVGELEAIPDYNSLNVSKLVLPVYDPSSPSTYDVAQIPRFMTQVKLFSRT
jgi:hypothetical protein